MLRATRRLLSSSGVKSVKEMVAAAKLRIENLSPAEANRRVQQDGALLIDIREKAELEREGAIPNAVHAPRGMLEFWVDPESEYFKPPLGENRELILF